MPPVWFLTRTTTAPTYLAGTYLPAGATVLWSIRCLHRDPAVFADPDTFDPDRWLPANSGPAQHRALVPFSTGQRRCLGASLGLTQASIILATILAHCELRPMKGSHPKPRANLTLRMAGMRMIVQPRPGLYGERCNSRTGSDS
jgi:pentalenene oxygenase